MIVIDNVEKNPNWQSEFLELLPAIDRSLQFLFCQLDSAAREEAVGEATAHALLSYRRLHDRGRAHLVTAATLAYYSSKQVKQGRLAVGRLNRNEPLARYAQVCRGFGPAPADWIDSIVDRKRTPIIEQVAMRLDLRAWLATLSERMNQFVGDFAAGFSTSEVARKHRVSASRVSQLRRELEQSWYEFQNLEAPAA